MSNPKIDQLDPGVGDVLVQQHYILRLKEKTGQKHITERGMKGCVLIHRASQETERVQPGHLLSLHHRLWHSHKLLELSTFLIMSGWNIVSVSPQYWVPKLNCGNLCVGLMNPYLYCWWREYGNIWKRYSETDLFIVCDFGYWNIFTLMFSTATWCEISKMTQNWSEGQTR